MEIAELSKILISTGHDDIAAGPVSERDFWVLSPTFKYGSTIYGSIVIDYEGSKISTYTKIVDNRVTAGRGDIFEDVKSITADIILKQVIGFAEKALSLVLSGEYIPARREDA